MVGCSQCLAEFCNIHRREDTYSNEVRSKQIKKHFQISVRKSAGIYD